MGRERAPRKRDMAHCVLSRRTVDRALDPRKTMRTCPRIVMMLIPMKNQFRLMPSKMFNLLSSRRLFLDKSIRASERLPLDNREISDRKCQELKWGSPTVD